MSDQGTVKPNGAEPPPRKSLRDVAEEAYDEVLGESTDDDGGQPGEQPPVDAGGQPRDAHGRFVSKPPEAQPGEAAPGEPAPSPAQEPAQPQGEPHPAPAQPGEAAQAPANWTAADRELFAKQTPEAQQFLLRRHSEMEGDYQRRVSANASATEFVNALTPIFSDPGLSQSLQTNNLSAYDAIRDWAQMHMRAINPDPRVRVDLWHEIGQRMGLDPAAVYGQSRPAEGQQPGALSEQDLKDPAIRFFADHVSRNANEVQALRGELLAIRQAEANKVAAEAQRVTRWGIDSFADEKGPDGKPLRPDFDTVLPELMQIYSVDPQRPMTEAYAQALWMNPTTRAKLIEAERTTATRAITDQRARQAVRGNVRGVTSPVTKPPDPPGSKSLRETLEATADEVGLN